MTLNQPKLLSHLKSSWWSGLRVWLNNLGTTPAWPTSSCLTRSRSTLWWCLVPGYSYFRTPVQKSRGCLDCNHFNWGQGISLPHVSFQACQSLYWLPWPWPTTIGTTVSDILDLLITLSTVVSLEGGFP